MKRKKKKPKKIRSIKSKNPDQKKVLKDEKKLPKENQE